MLCSLLQEAVEFKCLPVCYTGRSVLLLEPDQFVSKPLSLKPLLDLDWVGSIHLSRSRSGCVKY